MSANLVIVSMHEKGFPQADMYIGMAEMDPQEFEDLAPAPDDFFTMSRGNTLVEAGVKADDRWPGARIIMVFDDEDEDEE